MEKKILRTFRFLNSLFSGFGEARFIYDEPKPSPRAAEEESERVDQSEGEDLPGLDLENKKARKKIETKKEGEKIKGGVGRDKLKKDANLPKEAPKPVKCPENPPLSIDNFLEVDLAKQKEELDRWTINITRENYQVSAKIWDHSTVEGLDKMYQDCKKLGILDKDKEYYDTAFAVLRGAVEDNPHLATNGGEYRAMFKNPTDGKHRDTISSLGAAGSFKGGPAFIKAYDSVMVFLRSDILIAQDKAQLATLGAQQKQGVDQIGTAVVDFGRSTITTIQKAAQSRDYATLAVYAVGGYALWQTLGKKLFGGGHAEGEAGKGAKHFDFKKWLMIGAAVYGADKMLKNAGYDVLKMAGFKNMDAEVKGTPLESMKNILSMPQYNEEFKDLDYGIAMKMSESRLATLQELMLKANNDGVDFIHPNLFPGQFEELKGIWSFSMGQGEKGLKDYIGMGNSKLKGDQREYIRVGQQLFKLARSMGIIYSETLQKNHTRYKSMSYDVALADSILNKSKVRHMMEAAGQYAPVSVNDATFSNKKSEEITAKLREGTGKVLEVNGFSLKGGPELKEGSGHFAGYLKGFPIVVVLAKDGYRIYLRNRYGTGYNPAPAAPDAVIPLAGDGMKRGAEDAVKKVDARMEELVKKQQDGNKSIKGWKYENGKWVATTEFKGAADLDVAAASVPTLLNVTELGDNVLLDDGETSSEKYLERNVLGRLVGQPDFKLLGHFAAAGTLSMRDYKPGSAGTLPTFKLRIGKKGIETTIKYDKATKVFSFEPATQERDLLKPGSGFGAELREALGKNAQMSKVFDEWRKLLEETPKDYFYNFFKKVPNWFTRATKDKWFRGFGSDQISGSVAKNYTIALMETQKEFLMSKVANSVDGLATLQDAEVKMDNIMKPALQDWQAQLMNFSSLNTRNFKEGAEFSEEAFQEGVLRGLQEVGMKSNEYKKWNRKFTDEIFARTGKDDLWDEHATKGRDIVKIFAYYTAPLDDPEIDGVDLRFTLTPAEDARVKIIQEVERTYGLKVGVSAADDLTILGHATNIGTGRSISGFVAPDLDLVKKQNKKEKFMDYANYADYVVERIYLKINKGELKDSAVPGPGAWGIEEFKIWEKSKIMPSKPEFVDREPSLKMTRNYVPLDEYLLMTVAQKNAFLPTRRGDIALPRKTVDIKRYTTMKSGVVNPLAHPEDRKIILEVFGVADEAELKALLALPTNPSDPKEVLARARRINDKVCKLDKPNEINVEGEFVKTFRDALDHLRKEYAGKINEAKFVAIEINHSLNCSVINFNKNPTDPDFATIEYQYQSNSNLAVRIQELESRWTRPGVRVTRSEQMAEIKQLVGSIIEKDVLQRDRGFINYESLVDKGVNAVKEFWAWIWH